MGDVKKNICIYVIQIVSFSVDILGERKVTMIFNVKGCYITLTLIFSPVIFFEYIYSLGPRNFISHIQMQYKSDY